VEAAGLARQQEEEAAGLARQLQAALIGDGKRMRLRE
jgi:hypothetical protein